MDARPTDATSAREAPVRVHGLRIRDERTNRETLGSTDVRITGSNVEAWIEDAIRSLSDGGIAFGNSDRPDPSATSIEVLIKRASCRGAVMNMRSTVLLDVAYYRGSTLLVTKSYYGSSVEKKGVISRGTRHFDAKAVLRGLNRAMDDLLMDLGDDLRAFGAGRVPTPDGNTP